MALILAVNLTGKVHAQESMSPAAVVNDEVVSHLDLFMRLRMAIIASGLQDTPQTRERLLRPVLRQLIDEKLQLQEAKRLEISIPANYVDNGVQEIAERNGMDTASFLSALKGQGVLETALRGQVEASIAWQTIVQTRLRAQLNISQDEIDETVNRLRENEKLSQVRVAEIFLPFDSPSDEGSVRETAARLIEQMQQGASFAAVAQQFSQSATASVGGDMGWQVESELVPELIPVVKNMEKGALAGPVRALGGFYIVALIDRSSGATNSSTKLRLSQILFDVPEGKREEVMSYAVENTAEVYSCGQLEKLGADIGAPGSGSLGEVVLSDLPDIIQGAVADLPIGTPSTPIDLNGRISVLVVCLREGGESKITAEQVGQTLERERLDMLSRRYMRDLRRESNVDIRI
ncbi:peptidylprolyl isomerase [Rhodovibrionaceae bacterium A322]